MSTKNVRQSFHNGNLPIRVLSYDMLYHFQNTHFDFKDEVIAEVNFNNFKNGIVYDDRKKRISYLAQITPDRQIEIEEPYLAFLWTLCLVVVTLYRRQKSDYSTDPVLQRAQNSFNYGYSLFTSWNEWDLSLPNPEQYDLDSDPTIEEANGLFINAAKFILCHEYAHHFLDHFTDSQNKPDYLLKDDEFFADKHACEIILQGIDHNSEMGYSLYLGVLIGIASILFISPDWDGGDEHPDTDQRILKILEAVSPDDDDDIWRFATTIFLVWGVTFKKDLKLPKDIRGKDTFLFLIQHLKNQ